MLHPRRLVPLVVICSLASAAPVRGAEEAARNPIAPVTTEHVLALPDTVGLSYEARVETVPVRLAEGGAEADIAIVSYRRLGEQRGKRPVTFVFNGGPGASSAYLHLGAMGPKIVRMADTGGAPPPPVVLEDNPDSWLRFTDLVFVDPVGTGFSRAVGGRDAEKAFWSVSADVSSLAQVIERWLGRNGRWSSPIYIAGESYGGFRAAQLARTLARIQGVALSGLVMISPALDLSIIRPGAHDVLPWALALPSMVASARAHGQGAAAPPLEAVEAFALGEYLQGIAAIAPEGPDPGAALMEKLAQLLGLEIKVVRRWHGRVPAWVFAERVLQRPGWALSVYDGSIAGPDPRPGRSGPDPVLEGTKATLSSAFNAYVRDDLGLRIDREFRLLSPEPSRHWDWEGARGGPDRTRGAADELAEALALTPRLRVLVVHGRTDMVTPYLVTRWLLDRLELPQEVRGRIRQEELDGGHMMYFHAAQRTALTRLAAAFYEAAAEPRR